MCKLFNKDQVYNTRAISEIFFDANPNRFSTLRSCLTRIGNQATFLEANGIIAPINQQKKNRVYSGIHAELICESLCKKVKTDESNQELPLLTQRTIPYDSEVVEETEFGGWLGSFKGKHSIAEILITKQTSNGKDRLNIRFDAKSYAQIFGNSEKVSAYVSKKNSNLFIVPQAITGVPSWSLTRQGQSRKFAIQVEDPYKSVLLKFIGEYSLGELVQTGLLTPDGSSVKAWGFKAKS